MNILMVYEKPHYIILSALIVPKKSMIQYQWQIAEEEGENQTTLYQEGKNNEDSCSDLNTIMIILTMLSYCKVLASTLQI